MDQMKVLHGAFDMQTHKETFTNYLEVVIAPNGSVCYAVPSHVAVLERMYMSRTGGNPQEDCPREHWLSYDQWLIDQTECVCVWNCGTMGHPNARQREQLDILRQEGLLRDIVR